MIEAYIGLGSNLDNPVEKIIQAHQVLTRLPRISEVNFSSLYSSPPMGPQDQPDYVNAVMRVNTSLSAIELLRQMQQIELDFGRVRQGLRWGARTLDLDLLLYGEEEIQTDHLVVPHAGMADRPFVLYPLAEIAPEDLFIPGQGALKFLLSHCALNGLEKIH